MKLLFKKKRKIYKDDCINYGNEYKTCKKCEVVSHCIRYCPDDCKRYEKVEADNNKKNNDVPFWLWLVSFATGLVCLIVAVVNYF